MNPSEEAILWHGGQAAAAGDRFKALSADDRQKDRHGELAMIDEQTPGSGVRRRPQCPDLGLPSRAASHAGMDKIQMLWNQSSSAAGVKPGSGLSGIGH